MRTDGDAGEHGGGAVYDLSDAKNVHDPATGCCRSSA